MSRKDFLKKASEITGVEINRHNLEHAIKRNYVERPQRTRNGAFQYLDKHLEQLVKYIREVSIIGSAEVQGA